MSQTKFINKTPVKVINCEMMSEQAMVKNVAYDSVGNEVIIGEPYLVKRSQLTDVPVFSWEEKYLAKKQKELNDLIAEREKECDKFAQESKRMFSVHRNQLSMLKNMLNFTTDVATEFFWFIERLLTDDYNWAVLYYPNGWSTARIVSKEKFKVGIFNAEEYKWTRLLCEINYTNLTLQTSNHVNEGGGMGSQSVYLFNTIDEITEWAKAGEVNGGNPVVLNIDDIIKYDVPGFGDQLRAELNRRADQHRKYIDGVRERATRDIDNDNESFIKVQVNIKKYLGEI